MASYGTADMSSGSRVSNGTASSEHDALLPKPLQHKSLRSHFTDIVDKKHADLILLFGYIITGLLDSTATAVWGSFVSMQTGNTIYFSLGIVGSDPNSPTRWVKAGTSIACFCLGSFVFARFHRWLGGARRWVMVLSTLLQAWCIVAAALIVVLAPGAASGDKNSLAWDVLVPIGLVGFQSGGQAVISRVVKFNSLTSVVLTSIYCDLFSDAELFAGLTKNAERNRRLAAPILLVGGAICGGLWAKTDVGITGALWTAAAMKLATVLTWVFWKAEKKHTVT